MRHLLSSWRFFFVPRDCSAAKGPFGFRKIWHETTLFLPQKVKEVDVSNVSSSSERLYIRRVSRAEDPETVNSSSLEGRKLKRSAR